MDAGTLRSTKDGFCATCYAKAQMYCTKCKGRWYCSAACQAKDWHLGHKGDCGLADRPMVTAVPAPPRRMLPDSVDRPIHKDVDWRRLVETSDLGLRRCPPRGLRNVGNSCYMNSVLQGLHHAVPLLQAAIQQHQSIGCQCQPVKPVRTAWGGASSTVGGCFRCDLETVASCSLDPRADAAKDNGSSSLCLGDSVVLQGLKSDELNGHVGVVMSLPDESSSEEEARVGVRLQGSVGQKLVKPQNLELYCRSAAGPHEVLRWLPRLGEEFTFGAQEDAHEFLRSLLRLVEDEEVKEHAERLRQQAPEAAPEPNVDLTGIPSRIFGGILVSQCMCTRRECLASTFSFEPFMDLSLDITEVTDTVEDALRLFTAAERLDKKNGWKCGTCSEVVRARKQITIYSPPSCLVLHLKRFRFGERGKVTRPVLFESELNLRPFMCAGAPDVNRPLLYELRAVIVHLDKAGYSHFGHYVAYIRCAGDRKGSHKWYLLDDSQSMEVDEKEVLRQQAYLLIYSRTSGGVIAEATKRSGSNTDCDNSEQLPSKCLGRGGAVCNFFASAEGLCTRCYTEEFGRSPPAAQAAPAPEPGPPPAPASNGGYAAGSASAAPAAKGKAAPKTVAAVPAAPGKAKKIGANDPCPCGSGKKYKKCHGGA
eukprot:TRINITY_DN77898_c0_g1_i1.p1 TRINITY_DN77898_c0_g1~~TRINITY_DN77898_c0_g1_i1.p1  ORF type:complete len:649 (+),score=148.02 TRINITY_DN77898_c0_g1_i1:34-1980(+)